jgi:nucleoside-diphosphate-sugar epimerase
MRRILVTGAGGQIGSELVPALRERYGTQSVLATDIRALTAGPVADGPFQVLDATRQDAVGAAVMRFKADTIYHLAAILSAVGEKDPQLAYRINMGGLLSVLEVARTHGCAVFHPSSIGAFGPGTPPDPAPQDTLQRPTTMYGITKVAGELLCDYYHHRFGVDTRGVRYPGLDTCFLDADTQLDMMYMPDAIKAAIEVMEADPSRLVHRNAFNVTAMQLTPARLAAEIRGHIPDFEIDYDVDPVREAIAQSWPRRIDDTPAREEWGWNPEYDLTSMTSDMITQLRAPAGSP